MRTKVNDWLNPATGGVLYGIDVFYDGQWCHAAEGGKPLLFSTAAERDAKRREVRSQRPVSAVKLQLVTTAILTGPAGPAAEGGSRHG